MQNPNGPYPGRQIFIGKTPEGNPAFAYVVTGRSPASRERKATTKDNSIIMGPIDNTPYDPLRHYTAVLNDNNIGLLTVTNGIQTNAIYETYKLLYHTDSELSKDYLRTIMTGAKFEPDSLHTPRIAGLIMNSADGKPVYLLGIITDDPPASIFEINPDAGTLTGISTYNGNLENPEKFDTSKPLPVIELTANTPEKIAEYIYSISEASNNGEDIRVCAVGGVLADDKKTWNMHTINRHK